jgi:PAS domain S-box-containing protein
MKKKKLDQDEAANLKKRAEEKLRSITARSGAAPDEQKPDVNQLLHELEVHQLELEMQNDELRKAQIIIEEARHKYFELYDLAPVGYLVLDEKGKILDANLTAAELFGTDKVSFINKNINSYIARSERDILYLHLEKLIETKSKQSCELKLLKKDGTEFYGQLVCMPVQDENKDVNKYRAAVIDITERKQTEESLKESEASLRDAQRIANIGNWSLDLATGDVHMSNEMFHIIGMSKNDGFDVSQHEKNYTPESWRVYQNALKEAQEKGKGYEIEMEFANKDAEFHYAIARGEPVYDENNNLIGLKGTLQDITERKQAEQLLQKSEQYFRDLTENSSDIILVVSKSGTIQYSSNSMERFMGYKPEELIGQKVFNFIHPADIPRAIIDYGKAVLTKDSSVYNSFRIFHKDGSERILEGYGKNLFNNPIIAGFVMNIHDVSERKKAEKKLKESEEKYRVIAENAKHLIVTHDLNGKITYANAFALEFLNVTKDQIIGQSIAQFIHSNENMDAMKQRQHDFLAGRNIVHHYEINVKLSLGEERILEVFGNPIKQNDKINSVLIVAYDITESKKAEEEIRRKEKHLRSMVENPAGYVMYRTRLNRDTGQIEVVQVSPSFTDVLGISEKDKNNFQKWFSYVHTEDLPALMKANEEGMKPPFKLTLEVRYNHPKEGLKWIEIRANGIPYEDNPNLIEYANGVILDITERKKAEEERKKSDERFRIAQDMSPDGFTILKPIRNKQGRVIDFRWVYENNAVAKLNGTDPQKVVGKRLLELFPGHRDTQFMKAYISVAESGKSTTFEEGYSGETMSKSAWFRIVVVPMDENIAILAQDITNRKNAEEERKAVNLKLQETVQKLQLTNQQLIDTHKDNTLKAKMLDQAPIIIAQHDLDHRIVWANKVYLDSTGTSLEEAKGKKCWELWKLGKPCNNCPVLKTLETGKSHEYLLSPENQEHWPDTQGSWLARSTPIRDKNGKVVGAIETAMNVTMQLQAEMALHKSEEKYRKLIETTSEGFWLLNSEKKTIDVNQSLCDMLGYTRNEMIGKIPVEFTDAENRKIFEENLSKIPSTLHRSYEILLKKKNGINFPVIMNATSLFDKNGKPARSFAFVTDISERKQAENESKLSKDLLREVMDIVPTFICAKNLEGRFILINKKLTDFYCTTVDEMTGILHADICEDEDELQGMLTDDREVIEGGKIKFIPEETMKNPDGSITVLETYKIPFTALGEPAVLIASVDITERKKAEKQIQRDLKEKTLLLQEIHHRTKNNLQMISSLMQMQESTIRTKEDALKGFKVTQDRIRAMAKSYEIILRSEYMSELKLSDYITELADELARNYDVHGKVQMTYTMDDVLFDAEKLSKLGLILNEIITNSIKYAFVGRDQGNIHIILKNAKDHIKIKISDDGIGIPEKIKIPNTKTLGLSIVDMLISEFKGSYSVERKNGTSFNLTIPKKTEVYPER